MRGLKGLNERARIETNFDGAVFDSKMIVRLGDKAAHWLEGVSV